MLNFLKTLQNTNTLIVVVGPTAIGKTALAIQLAQHFGSEIISCDSRQFYKEMCIGTAVPSVDELQAAPHHFIQNISITQNYSVGDFEREALEKLTELFAKNPIQIMVGGSGLYVDAVIKGFDDFPDIDAKVRESVVQQYNFQGLEYLQNQLKELDPVYYQYILENNAQTLQNPQRLMRFVEVCLGTQKPYSSFLNQPKKQRDFNVILIGLEADRAVLNARINLRVDLMMQQGLLEEVKSVEVYKHLNALQTVGYKELFDYLARNISLEQAVEDIKMNTRRFAKRQMTWFKRNAQIQWFEFKTPLAEIITQIQTYEK